MSELPGQSRPALPLSSCQVGANSGPLLPSRRAVRHAVEPPRIGGLFDGYHQSTEAAQDVVHHALFLLDVEMLTLRASAVTRARCLSGRGSSKAHVRPGAEPHVTAALSRRR